MNANLVRAAGFQHELQLAVAGQFFAQLVVRHRGLAVGADRILEPVVRVAPERSVDRTGAMLGNSDHQAQIDPLDRAALHRLPERAQPGLGFGNQQQARRVAVEPVNETGLERIPGQGLRVREQRVRERPVARAVGWVADHAGRLVDDQQNVILEHDVERDILGLRVENGNLRDRELQPVAVGDRRRPFGDLAVQTHGAAAYGGRHACPRRA